MIVLCRILLIVALQDGVEAWPAWSTLWGNSNSYKFELEDAWKMYDHINAMRLNASLPILLMNEVLCSSATQFAWEHVAMITKGLAVQYPPHIGMNFSTPRTRMQASGFKGIAWGENEIITATNKIQVAEELLELDQENKSNMLGKYDQIGIGFAWILCRDIPNYIHNSTIGSIGARIHLLCSMLQVLPESKRCLHVVVQKYGQSEPDLRDDSRIKDTHLDDVEEHKVSRHHYILRPYIEHDLKGSMNLTDLTAQQHKERMDQLPVPFTENAAFIPPSDLIPQHTTAIPVGLGSVNTASEMFTIIQRNTSNPSSTLNLTLPSIPPKPFTTIHANQSL